jgi:hypothetical protein
VLLYDVKYGAHDIDVHKEDSDLEQGDKADDSDGPATKK